MTGYAIIIATPPAGPRRDRKLAYSVVEMPLDVLWTVAEVMKSGT